MKRLPKLPFGPRGGFELKPGDIVRIAGIEEDNDYQVVALHGANGCTTAWLTLETARDADGISWTSEYDGRETDFILIDGGDAWYPLLTPVRSKIAEFGKLTITKVGRVEGEDR